MKVVHVSDPDQGSDVPAPADHPWRSLPAGREAMTIHCSGMTREAQDRIAEGVAEMLDAHLAGQPLPEDFLVVTPGD